MAQASPIFHFLKEDTKRHRKTLWKSGSIIIATKKKIQRPSQGNLRRLSLCPEGGGSLYAIQTQAPLFLSRLPALELRALLRGTPENHHGALQQAPARSGQQAPVWPRMEADS